MMRLVSNMYICAPETPLSEKEMKGLFLLYLPRSDWILQMQARFSFSQEDMCVVLNEAEKLIENEISGEPEMEQVIVLRKRTKGKRDLNLKDIEVEIIQHECTPELAAAVFNAKYVNAVPLNRLSEEFLRNDVNIPRQDMAGWMIRLYEYLGGRNGTVLQNYLSGYKGTISQMLPAGSAASVG